VKAGIESQCGRQCRNWVHGQAGVLCGAGWCGAGSGRRVCTGRSVVARQVQVVAAVQQQNLPSRQVGQSPPAAGRKTAEREYGRGSMAGGKCIVAAGVGCGGTRPVVSMNPVGSSRQLQRRAQKSRQAQRSRKVGVGVLLGQAQQVAMSGRRDHGREKAGGKAQVGSREAGKSIWQA